jgi:2-aminoethylphosphonate-pyruvate transaminase
MKPVNTAVILAAGLGSRLGDIKEDQPKAFVKVGPESLIERSIRLLIEKGFTSIIIGTGYKNEYFDDLRKKYPQITTCKNPDFDKTGSMYTLYLLRNLISKPFLLLEGDLLYEQAALDLILEDEKEDVILASDATNSGDEVFIQGNEQYFLERMSKKRSDLRTICGELVGISKLTTEVLQAMNDFAEGMYRDQNYAIHYEDALVGIAKESNLYVKIVADMAWCEIDDPAHYERAISKVYPKILQRS